MTPEPKTRAVTEQAYFREALRQMDFQKERRAWRQERRRPEAER